MCSNVNGAFGYEHVESNMIESNMIESNMIESNMIESNMIESNMIESNRPLRWKMTPPWENESNTPTVENDPYVGI